MQADESGGCPLGTKTVGRIGALAAAGFVASMLGAVGCGSQLVDDVRPGPYDTVAVAGRTLYVPPGFSVNIFAEGQVGVRFLALGPGGAVYATLSRSGTIVRLVDANHDGVAESVVTVLSGLNDPSGIAFRGDTLYFAELNAVKRLDPGATTPVFVTALPSGPGHDTRTIAFGPDNFMYVAVGSSCNICDDAPPRAAVTRYNLDGSNAHTFAPGLRNSVGVAFHPTTA